MRYMKTKRQISCNKIISKKNFRPRHNELIIKNKEIQISDIHLYYYYLLLSIMSVNVNKQKYKVDILYIIQETNTERETRHRLNHD